MPLEKDPFLFICSKKSRQKSVSIFYCRFILSCRYAVNRKFLFIYFFIAPLLFFAGPPGHVMKTLSLILTYITDCSLFLTGIYDTDDKQIKAHSLETARRMCPLYVVFPCLLGSSLPGIEGQFE